MLIRDARDSDAEHIVEIYNHYISTSHATFELDPIGADEMRSRIRASFQNGYPFLTAEADGKILGYAYGHQYRERPAYRNSVEVSVYVGDESAGQGIGSALYQKLIPALVDSGFHAIIAGISLPNEASIRLHEKFGFEKVAHFRRVGRKFDRWIDVGYWQLLV